MAFQRAVREDPTREQKSAASISEIPNLHFRGGRPRLCNWYAILEKGILGSYLALGFQNDVLVFVFASGRGPGGAPDTPVQERADAFAARLTGIGAHPPHFEELLLRAPPALSHCAKRVGSGRIL